MITEQEALVIAKKHLRGNLSPDQSDIIIREDMIIKKPYGWLFFYQTKRYLETKQSEYAIIGDHPFIVEKSTGRVAHLRGRANIDFPFDGDYDELFDLQIACEDRLRETEAAK
jgi:hypothetical protein